MNPPFKRRRFSARDDSEVELHQRRVRNDLRLKSTFESIFDKYGKNFNGIGDEIDLETGEIIVNNGHILGMTNERDVGDADEYSDEIGSDEWSDDEDSVITSSLRKKQKPAGNCQDQGTPPTEFETALQSEDEADSLMGDPEIQPSLPNSAKRSGSDIDTYKDDDDEDELASNETEWLTPKKTTVTVEDHWRLPTQKTPLQYITAFEPAWRAPPLPIQNFSHSENEPPPSDIFDESEDGSDVSQPGVSIWAVDKPKTRQRTRDYIQWTGEDQSLLRYLKTATALKYKQMEKYFPGRHKQSIAAKWAQMVLRDKESPRLSHSHFTHFEQPGQLRQILLSDTAEYPKSLSRRADDDGRWIPHVVSISRIFESEPDRWPHTGSRVVKHRRLSYEGDKVHSNIPAVALPKSKPTIRTSIKSNSAFVQDGQNSMGVKLLDEKLQIPRRQALHDSSTALERERPVSSRNMEACDSPYAPHPTRLEIPIARHERLNDNDAFERYPQNHAGVHRLIEQGLNSLESWDDHTTRTDEVYDSQRSASTSYVSNAGKSFEDNQTSGPLMGANNSSIECHPSELSESCICQLKGQGLHVANDCDEPQDQAISWQSIKEDIIPPDGRAGMQDRISAVTRAPENSDSGAIGGSNDDPSIRASQQDHFVSPLEKPIDVMPSCIGAAEGPPCKMQITPPQFENLGLVISNQNADYVPEADDLAKTRSEESAIMEPTVEELHAFEETNSNERSSTQQQPQSWARGAISEIQKPWGPTEASETHSPEAAQGRIVKRKRGRPKKESVAGPKSKNTTPSGHMNGQDQTYSQVGSGRQVHTPQLDNLEQYNTGRSHRLEVAECISYAEPGRINQSLIPPELDASHIQNTVSTPIPSMRQKVRESSAHTNHETSTVKSSPALETSDSQFSDRINQMSLPTTGLETKTSKTCIADSFSSEIFDDCSDDDLAILSAIPPQKRSYDRKYCKPAKARTLSSYLADESDDELSTPIKTVGTPIGVKVRSS